MPSVSKSQQRLMGMVHACQKYGKCSSPKVRKLAKTMKKQDAEDFAKTKHDDLPETKESISFKDWLALVEVGTTTADVATVPTPVFNGPIRRQKKMTKS